LTLGATSVEQSHSAAANSVGDSRVRTGELGMRHVPGTGNEIGLRWRRSFGDYPNQQIIGPFAVDNSYVEDSIDLNGSWQPSGASGLTGYLGRARRSHAELPGRDYLGRVGSLAWNWTVSGKTSISAAARRSLDTEGDINASYAITDSVSLRASWAPTAKIAVQGSLERRWRDYQGDPLTVVGVPARQELYDTVGLNASYAPLRDLRLSIGLLSEKRDSNIPGKDYRTNQANAAVQFTF
jgi:hypothetical protein